MRRIVAPLILLALVEGSPVAGQRPSFVAPIAEADSLYLAGEPLLSLERLQPYLEGDTTDYDALWRAARASVVIAIEEEDHLVQNGWLDPALQYASKAAEARPGDIDGLYWRGVSAGRRAMNAGPGYAVELAQVVYDDANAILAVDSLHGGAHNMLGKLNYEVMSLSRVKRLIARTFMGNEALKDSSWEQAEHHLRAAVETWPDFVLFHFDLAQLYRKKGRWEEAAAEYARALDLPAVHPTDRRFQAQARDALIELDVAPDALRSAR
jgi:tetratricopeptide (TPR) repeat protein